MEKYFMDYEEQQIQDAGASIATQKNLVDTALTMLPELEVNLTAQYQYFEDALNDFEIQAAVHATEDGQTPEAVVIYKNSVTVLRDRTQSFLTLIAVLDQQLGQIKSLLRNQHMTAEIVKNAVAVIIDNEGISG